MNAHQTKQKIRINGPHSSSNVSARRRRAFTLIELLISILLPALANARATARSISCANQVRQLGLMTELYRNDNDGYYIPIVLSGPIQHWPIIAEYYLNVQFTKPTYIEELDTNSILYCPEVDLGLRNPSARNVSYGYNRFGVGGNTTPPGGVDYAGLKRELPSQPSETLMFVDSDAVSQTAQDGWYEAYNHPNLFFARHMDRSVANAVFADGHAENMKDEQLHIAGGSTVDAGPWFGKNYLP